jgi:hypothetical protein
VHDVADDFGGDAVGRDGHGMKTPDEVRIVC